MKNMFRKTLAVLLAILMLLGVSAAGAFAESAPGTEEESIPEQAEVMEEDNAVQAEEESPKKLVVQKTEIIITVGEYVSMADLLEGTTWGLDELFSQVTWNGVVEFDLAGNGGYIKGFTGVKPGKATVGIMTWDGESAEIKITVEHTGWNWVKHYLLAGCFFELIGLEKPDDFFGYLRGGLINIIVGVAVVLALPFLPITVLASKLTGIF